MKPKFIAYAAAREIHNNIMAVLEGKPQTREYTEYLTRANGSPVYHSSPRVAKPAKGMLPNVDGWSTMGSKGTSIVFTHKALDSYCTITVTPSKVIFSPYVFTQGNRIRINRLMRALGMGDQLYFRMEKAKYDSNWCARQFIKGHSRREWCRVRVYSYMGRGNPVKSCATRFAGDTVEYYFKTGSVAAVSPDTDGKRIAQFVMQGYDHADVVFHDTEQGIDIPIPEFVDTVCGTVAAIFDIGAQDEACERSKPATLTTASTSLSAFVDRIVRNIMGSTSYDRAPLYRGTIKRAVKDLLRFTHITHNLENLVVYTPLEGDGLPRGAWEYAAADAKLVLVPCV
jgi:hypothetical protein